MQKNLLALGTSLFKIPTYKSIKEGPGIIGSKKETKCKNHKTLKIGSTPFLAAVGTVGIW
jgi:hypothetical protein